MKALGSLLGGKRLLVVNAALAVNLKKVGHRVMQSHGQTELWFRKVAEQGEPTGGLDVQLAA
jgi:hypothetical protein